MDIFREKLRATGCHRLCCSDAPDTSGINKAAEANAQVASDALQWYKQQYADSAGARQQAADDAHTVSQAQLKSMQDQSALADEYAAYNRGTFRPLEQSIVDDANTFDTEGKREELAGKALGDVNQQFASARDQNTRTLSRMGVNPNDGRAMAMQGVLIGQQALAGADAENKARSNALTMGRAMKMDAASLGRNLPSNQATSAGLALTAGNAAAANGQVPWTVAQQGAGLMGQGFNTAIQGNSSAGNLYGAQAGIQAQANAANNGIMSALGSGVGMWAGGGFRMPSDQNIKEGVKPVSDEEALDAVNSTPVSKWKYKPDSSAADGGQEHIGPMAQDVQKTMGSEVAPQGKLVDLISANGITMKGLQAVNRKVDKLAASLGIPI